MAVAAVAAGAEIVFFGDAAQLESLVDVMSYGFLHPMHFLLSVQKATGDRIVLKLLAALLEFGDFLVS